MQKASIAMVVGVMALGQSSPVLSQSGGGEVLRQLEQREALPTIPLPAQAPPAPLIERQQQPPAGARAAGERIRVKAFNIQGATLMDRAALEAIVAPYQNKDLSLAEMARAADAITAAYRQNGWLVAYAHIPVQEIKDGVVEIRVMEGKTGAISVTGNTSYSGEFIQKHLDRIKDDPSPREETLERALLILNDYPSLDVRARLRAGRDFGTTDIIAEAKDSRPLSGSLSYDNFGSDITSEHRLSAAFNIGNLITSGDNLMFRGLTGLDKLDLDKLSFGRLEYLIPVDYNGTRLGAYYTNTLYQAGEQFAILDVHGKANVAGIYLTHPLIKARTRSLDIRLGFDHKDVRDHMLGSLRSEDNIRVFNLGLTYDFRDKLQGRNILSLTYHQGVRDIFGGSGANDPGTSRRGADGAFGKYAFEALRAQQLSRYNHLMLRATGQISNDPLFAAEQFYLGGVGTVRGFRPSARSGDTGYALTAELHLSPISPGKRVFNQHLGDTIKLVLFADHGGVYKNNVQPGENKEDDLTSLGAGLRFYHGRNVSVRLDWAVPRIDGNFRTRNAETYMQAVFSF